MAQIIQTRTASQIEQARALFLEYGASLGFSLCFQSFDQELAGLPGDYAPPCGRLLLAEVEGKPAGCVALHRLGESCADKRALLCEMKRLYVRPEFRGQQLGRQLVEEVMLAARSIGYKKMRLDTVEPVMGHAVALYRGLGFHEIPAYRENPMPGTLYMELDL
jgi:putative acetyltransferase